MTLSVFDHVIELIEVADGLEISEAESRVGVHNKTIIPESWSLNEAGISVDQKRVLVQ